MMKFLEKNSDQHSLIGLCMGEQGIISRVLGVRAGSAFTFAAVSEDEKTAPGQVDRAGTAQHLSHRTGRSRHPRLCRGWRSRGPLAFARNHERRLAPRDRERRLPRPARQNPKRPAGLRARNSHPRPLHHHALQGGHRLRTSTTPTPITEKIGACNTVVRAQDGKLYGFNTDAAGVVRPLQQRISLEGAKMLVLGAGGAARAAVYGLKERGAEVYILNRTLGAAQKLARSASARLLKRADMQEARLRRDHQRHVRRHGRHQRVAAQRKRNQRALCFRHGLRSRRNPSGKMARAAGCG